MSKTLHFTFKFYLKWFFSVQTLPLVLVQACGTWMWINGSGVYHSPGRRQQHRTSRTRWHIHTLTTVSCVSCECRMSCMSWLPSSAFPASAVTTPVLLLLPGPAKPQQLRVLLDLLGIGFARPGLAPPCGTCIVYGCVLYAGVVTVSWLRAAI